ncbi:MAG TPA: S8 family peptidase, partial [Thermoanaerobaculia bacterium]|nr:S8 family peptidase [Thermoanaerobaculia bacterium]
MAFTAVLLFGLSGFAFAGDGTIKKNGNKVPNQYIVALNADIADVDALASELSSKHGGLKEQVYKHAFKGFSVKMSEAMAAQLSLDPRVDYVEEDGYVSMWASQANATWGLDRVDQRDLPLNSTYNYDRTGAGVKAYILDTGILATHTDLGGRVISGYDAVGGGTTDCNGHGTHVSGTVGGSTWGVAKGVTLVAVRVLDCAGSGSWSGVIAGVDWVTADHAAGQPAVANMSLGGAASSSVDTAVSNSIADGVTYAISAGNDYGADACTKTPARVATAITVASSTSTDARSSFSNIGTCVDIFAPGSSITSAWYTSNTATNTISGTSMAAPHVAGVAALYLEATPSATPAAVGQALKDNATPNKITDAGTGSPNLLLHSLFGAAAPPPPAPSGDFSLSVNPSSVSVSRTGGTATYTVTITRTGGFADAVSLSASGQPAGST